MHIHPRWSPATFPRTYSTECEGEKKKKEKKTNGTPKAPKSSESPNQKDLPLQTFNLHNNASGKQPSRTAEYKPSPSHESRGGREYLPQTPKSLGADHRTLGTFLSLFTTHPSSPGSPLFQPDGTHIFQKLQAFLRAQYQQYGIREVITPTIYKENIWVQSGHSANYKDDMFTVTGRGAQGLKNESQQIGEDEQYGLKPMNCPGHCLLFASQKRSYRDLPIRYADFSPLHRNEISGSLSGLTRLRRFHQDDAHIFCRPGQVKQEIETTLEFVQMVYSTFDLGSYRLVLSTRPESFIGKKEEWEQAEAQLKAALTKSRDEFQISVGHGAFYGPKIDIILADNNGKEHQTATIQLDFQLPKRFELEYLCPLPRKEATRVSTTDPDLMVTVGAETPVIIHRAILGSLERFMALLIERYQGHWPFWLSPRQMIILTVGTNSEVDSRATAVQEKLSGLKATRSNRRLLDSTTFAVHIDLSDRSLAKKLVEARKKQYNIIGIFGAKNLEGETLDLSFYGQSSSTETWQVIEQIKPGSAAPVQKGVAANKYRNIPGVKFTIGECLTLMIAISNKYL